MKRQSALQSVLSTYVRYIVIFIAAVAAGVGIFAVSTQRAIESYASNIILSNVQRQRDQVLTTLNLHFSYLEGAAEFLGSNEDLLCPDNYLLMNAITEKTDFQKAMLLQPDGVAHYSDGQVKDVSFRRYYWEVMEGKRSLSDPLDSVVDGETRIALAVPVFHNGAQTGALAASYNVTALSALFTEDIYDGKGSCMMVTPEGMLVSIESNPEYSQIQITDNFFTYYGQKTFVDASLESLRQDFRNQQGGLVKLQDGSNAATRRYMAYLPLGINDWMVCYVVPQSVAQANYTFITNYEYIFICVFALLVLILISAILRVTQRQKLALLQAAATDALTGAYNKTSFEQAATLLLENTPPQHCHALLLLDLDYFKQVNDRFGHAEGDEVLRKVGALLHGYFRKGDLIGRIGGDEFAVLLTNVTNREEVVQRIFRLNSLFHQIRLTVDPQQKISASIGVVFTREGRNTFQELYLQADKALYETKRKGRNGCTVYDAPEETISPS